MSHGADVYTSFIHTITDSLIENIDTVATTNQCLQIWTNTTQELNEAYISDPLCELADPSQPWDPVSNPYVPEGYDYVEPQPPKAGSTSTTGYITKNSDGDLYYVSYYQPTEGSDNEDQVDMVNALNGVQSPDEMSDFLGTYATSTYTDDWTQSFANTVMAQEMNPEVYDPDTDTDDAGTVSTNMNMINSEISLISADAQQATTPGNNEVKAIQSEEQTLQSYQDVFMGIARALGEVGQAVITNNQNHL